MSDNVFMLYNRKSKTKGFKTFIDVIHCLKNQTKLIFKSTHRSNINYNSFYDIEKIG